MTSRVAEALALPSLGKKPVQTAGGMIQTERYAFRIGFYPDDAAYPHTLDGTFYGIGLADSDSFQIIAGMDVIGRNHLELHRDGTSIFRFGSMR